LAGKVPVFGATFKSALQKLGFGIYDSNRIKKGECVCLRKSLYIASVGNGLFFGPMSGNGHFFRPKSRMNFEKFISGFKNIEPLSNYDIIDKCKELKIKNFKGVFMRDELNKKSE